MMIIYSEMPIQSHEPDTMPSFTSQLVNDLFDSYTQGPLFKGILGCKTVWGMMYLYKYATFPPRIQYVLDNVCKNDADRRLLADCARTTSVFRSPAAAMIKVATEPDSMLTSVHWDAFFEWVRARWREYVTGKAITDFGARIRYRRGKRYHYVDTPTVLHGDEPGWSYLSVRGRSMSEKAKAALAADGPLYVLREPARDEACEDDEEKLMKKRKAQAKCRQQDSMRANEARQKRASKKQKDKPVKPGVYITEADLDCPNVNHRKNRKAVLAMRPKDPVLVDKLKAAKLRSRETPVEQRFLKVLEQCDDDTTEVWRKCKIIDQGFNLPITVNVHEHSRTWLGELMSNLKEGIKEASLGFGDKLKPLMKVIKWSVMAIVGIAALRLIGGGARSILEMLGFVAPKHVSDAINGYADAVESRVGVARDQAVDVSVDIDGIIELVTALSFPMLFGGSMSTILKGNFKDFAGTFLKEIHKARTAPQGVETFIEVGLKCVNLLLRFICAVLKVDVVRLRRPLDEALATLRKDIEEVSCAFATGKFDSKPENLSRLVHMRERLAMFKESYTTVRSAQVSIQQMDRDLGRVMAAHAVQLHSLRGHRVQPVMTVFLGPPGLGKSTTMTQFVREVLAQVEPKMEEMSDAAMIYSKDTGQYWPGYNNQPGLILDDWLATVPNPTQENDASLVLKAVNPALFPLEMADVESKGKAFFNSKVIVATTNCTSLKDVEKTVLHVDALFRRLHHTYEMRLNPKYEKLVGVLNPSYSSKVITNSVADSSKYFLDRTKLEAYKAKKGKFPWEWWEVRQVKYTIGMMVPLSEWIPVRGLIMKVRKDLQTNKEIYEASATARPIVTDFSRPCTVDPSLYDDFDAYLDGTLDVESVGSSEISEGPICDQAKAEGKAQFHNVPPELFTHPMFHNDYDALMDELAPDTAAHKRNVDIANIVATFSVAFFSTLGIRILVDTIMKIVRSFGRTKKDKNIGTVKKLVAEMTDDEVGLMLKTANSIADQSYENPFANMPRNMRSAPQVLALHNSVYVIDQGGFYAIALGLCKRWFVLNTHCLKRLIKNGGECTIYNYRSRQEATKFSVADLLKFKQCADVTSDVAVLEIPTTSEVKDIMHLIITDADDVIVRNRTATLHVPIIGETGTGFSRHTSDRLLETCNVPIDSVYRDTLSKSFEMRGIATTNGDCGSPLVLNQGCESRFLIGIHSAGADKLAGSLGVAFSAKITQEKLQHMMHTASGQQKIVDQSGDHFPADGTNSFKYVRTLPMKEGTSSTPYSTLVRTRLWDRLQMFRWNPKNRSPARLWPFVKGEVKIYPMRRAVTIYGSQPVPMTDPNLKQACYTAFRKLRENLRGTQLRVLTFEEAVAGVPNDPYIKGIPRKTSPGHPYKLKYKSGKKEFFGKADEYDFSSAACAELRAEVEAILEDAKKGIRREHIFVDFLKDELRSEAKVQVGATRMISSAPVAYVIAFRMLFMDLCSKIQAFRIHTGTAIGVNVYSEWDAMVRHLTRLADKGFAGDFKEYDANQQEEGLKEVGVQMRSFYHDEYDLAREVLWMEVFNSKHLGGEGGGVSCTIYEWVKSLPSGHPATSIINSFYNITLFVLSFAKLTGKPVEAFWDHVSIMVYGDDNVVFPSAEISGVYNQDTIPAVMREYGMTYTGENKDGAALPPLRPIGDMTFLKRGFKHQDGKWTAPLELESILTQALYVPDKFREREIMAQNLEGMLREFAIHGKEVFDDYAPELCLAMQMEYQIAPDATPDCETYYGRALASENPW